MKTLFISLIVGMLAFGACRFAYADIYADDVLSVVGTFGNPTATFPSSIIDAKSKVLGAPDQGFIQLSDGTVIVIEFTDNVVDIDINPFSADLVLDTYDSPFPAGAKVEVSDDGLNWVEVFGRSLNDCNIGRTALIYDDVGTGPDPGSGFLNYLDLTHTGLTQITYVRITDLGTGSIPYLDLGFDLDALYSDLDHHLFITCDTAVPVDIDLKPGSDPNSINLNSKGVTTVALFGNDISVLDVDLGTVEFADATLLRAKIDDVNFDGYDDLILKFKVSDLNLDMDSTSGCLTGELLDATPFVACDTVNIVPSE